MHPYRVWKSLRFPFSCYRQLLPQDHYVLIYPLSVLNIDSHIVFAAFYCRALSITTDRASTCIAEKKIFVSRATSSNGNSVFSTFPSHTVLLDCKSEVSGIAPTSKFCRTSTLILFKIIYVHIQQETTLIETEWHATLIKSESFKVSGKKYHPFARAKTPSNKTRWI
jgi:hypothetical protein